MSSFKRKGQNDVSLPGTRPSPFNAAPVMSTGLNSIDDLLGGGLALNSMLLVECDQPTSYSDLLVDAFIAQGFESQHDLLVLGSTLDSIGDRLETRFIADDADVTAPAPTTTPTNSSDELKIAFRYDKMKHVTMSVPEHASASSSAGVPYCSLFDMTARRNLTDDERARLSSVLVDDLDSDHDIIERIEQSRPLIARNDKSRPLRIVIASCGTLWYRLSPQSRFRLFARLRRLIDKKNVCVIVSLPATLGAHRERHLFDGILSLCSFAGDPAAEQAFPRHQGLVNIPRVPSIGSLVGGGIKLSVLRKGGNLGFRVKRKRFVIENVGDQVDPGGPPTTTTTASSSQSPATTTEGATTKASAQDKETTKSKVKFANVPIVLGSEPSDEADRQTERRALLSGPIDF